MGGDCGRCTAAPPDETDPVRPGRRRQWSPRVFRARGRPRGCALAPGDEPALPAPRAARDRPHRRRTADILRASRPRARPGRPGGRPRVAVPRTRRGRQHRRRALYARGTARRAGDHARVGRLPRARSRLRASLRGRPGARDRRRLLPLSPCALQRCDRLLPARPVGESAYGSRWGLFSPDLRARSHGALLGLRPRVVALCRADDRSGGAQAVLSLRAARRLLGARRPHRHPRLLFPDGSVLAQRPAHSGIEREQAPEPPALGQSGLRQLHRPGDPHPVIHLPAHHRGRACPRRNRLGRARPSGRRIREHLERR